MKKFLVLFFCLVIVMCLALFGCDNADTPAITDGASVTTTTQSDVTTTQAAATTTTAPITTTTAAPTTTTTAPPVTTGPVAIYKENSVIPENPSGDKILFGTPTVDGELDLIYLPSYRYAELPLQHVNYAPLGKTKTFEYMKNTHGVVYYLYDDDYLYVCISVYDETLCSRGEEWRSKTEWPWSDDGAEIYLWFSNEENFAIHSDAHNIRSVRDVHIEPERKSDSVYTTTPREDWCAKINEDGKSYVIELRVPLPDFVGSGSQIGTLLEINDRFDITQENMIGALFLLPRYAGAKNFLVTLE